MLVWQVVVLVAFVSCALGAGAWMALKEHRRQKSSEAFFREADARTGSSNSAGEGIANLSFPLADIAAYEKAKKQMYKQYAAEGTPYECTLKPNTATPAYDSETAYTPSSDEESDEAEPAEPWQRSMPDDAKKALKVLLIKRAMGSIPAVRQLASELSAKAHLNQMQLMSAIHWETVQLYRRELDTEISYIRREAEALEPQWGFEDKVFREANLFYHHNQMKAKKAKELAKQEREDREEKERQKRYAERMMRGLLKDEENEKKQREAAGGGSLSSTVSAPRSRATAAARQKVVRV